MFHIDLRVSGIKSFQHVVGILKKKSEIYMAWIEMFTD